MKYCPNCGSDLPTADILFCPECGKKLSERGKRNTSGPNLEKPQEARRKPYLKKKKGPFAVEPQPDSNLADNPLGADDGYDGYYDDVIPSDEGGQQEGIDKEILKKVLLITVGVLLIISICVVFLCML